MDTACHHPLRSPSQSLRRIFVPLELVYDALNASLIYTSDDTALFWQPDTLPRDIIASYIESRRTQWCRTVHGGLESPPVWRRLGALSYLCHRRPREQNRLDRQLRDSYNDLWRNHCQHIVSRRTLRHSYKNVKCALPLDTLTNVASPKPALVINYGAPA